MGLFDRHAVLLERVKMAEEMGGNPFRVCMESVLSPTEAIINGRKTLLVGTNNYLGLTFDASCIAAAVDALKAEGTGTTGSRIANGSYAEHELLEREIAEFFGMKHCMVFTTGYQANLGTIATLVGPGDYVIIDADSHASIYDAARMSAATIIRFRHNDAADLDKRLARLANEKGNKLVVVEGIYSMLGDKAPLKELFEATKRNGGYFAVDEAHSLGVSGTKGRGVVEEAGILDQVDFVVGTFSKAMGAVGGYCVSNHPDFDVLRVATRAYMFSASLPPSVIASVRQALRILGQRPELMAKLWANVDTLYDGFTDVGFTLGPMKGPVVAVQLPTSEMAVAIWHALLQAGIYVNLALPPATPNNVPLLRCSVCAAHSKEQLLHLVDTLAGIGRQFGVIAQPARAAAG